MTYGLEGMMPVVRRLANFTGASFRPAGTCALHIRPRPNAPVHRDGYNNSQIPSSSWLPTMNTCSSDTNNNNDPLGAQSVHVARDITITRRRQQQDVAPRKPRRIYDSPPTIALRRGFSYDATPHLPIRSLLVEEADQEDEKLRAKAAPEKTKSADSAMSLAICLRQNYMAGADRATVA